MSVTNHTVRPEHNLDLAMIEGREIMTFCGVTFVPTVTPGTSGRADVPGAPRCEFCDEAMEISRQWSRIKREKNRLIREMRALEKAHMSVIQERRDPVRRTGAITATSEGASA